MDFTSACFIGLTSKNLFPSCSFQPVLHNWHNKDGAMPIMAWRQVCAFVFFCFFGFFLNYHHGLNVTYILDAKQLNVSTATLYAMLGPKRLEDSMSIDVSVN